MQEKAYRQVNGYEPANDLIDVMYTDAKTGDLGDPCKFLQTKYRLLWFHRYLEENNLSGFVDDSELYYDEVAQALIAKATVYIDGEVVGRACAGAFYNQLVAQDAKARTIGANVGTQAKGRALAVAGFSTQECYRCGLSNDLEAHVAKVQSSGLRECDFHVRDFIVVREDGKPYLPASIRMQWFNRYLAYTRKSGYIDSSDVSYDPKAKLFLCTARVYIDGKLVGISAASRAFDPAAPNIYGEVPVVEASRAAMIRALENAGFDVAGQAVLCEDVPCDGGVRISRDEMGTHVYRVYQQAIEGINVPRTPKLPPMENPAPSPVVPTPSASAGDEIAPTPKKRGRKPKAKTEDEQIQPQSQPSAQEPAPSFEVPASVAQVDLDTAKNFVVPVGSYQGMTLGDVMADEQGAKSMKFYASERFTNPAYAAFKQAVQALLK